MNIDLPRSQPLTPERSRILGADPARQPLLDQIMTASTRREIDADGQAQLVWLRANPDDFGVLGAGEDLAYAFESLCLKLLEAMGYTWLPANGQSGEGGLMRRPGGPADQRLAVECIWTYHPARVDAIHAFAIAMRRLHATEGLLIAGTGVNDDATHVAERLSIQVIDSDELDRLLRTYAPDLLGDDQGITSEQQSRAATLGWGDGGRAP